MRIAWLLLVTSVVLSLSLQSWAQQPSNRVTTQCGVAEVDLQGRDATGSATGGRAAADACVLR